MTDPRLHSRRPGTAQLVTMRVLVAATAFLFPVGSCSTMHASDSVSRVSLTVGTETFTVERRADTMTDHGVATLS